MVSNTGWTSVGELLMTRRISLVASLLLQRFHLARRALRPLERRSSAISSEQAALLRSSPSQVLYSVPSGLLATSRRYDSVAIDNRLRELPQE